MDLRQTLFENQDLSYKKFQSKLVPNISPEKIIGVRMPVLRKIAKSAYLDNSVNLCEYYDEIMVKGITIGMKKCSVSEHIKDITEFVSLIDNWATCDICATSFKFVSKDLPGYYDFIRSYIGKGEFETRFAVVMLMSFYINDDYIDRVLAIFSSVKTDFYYVNMALGWAISVAFVKYRDKTLDLIEQRVLPAEVQNKAIQKIKESLRVCKDDKKYLNQFKM